MRGEQIGVWSREILEQNVWLSLESVKRQADSPEIGKKLRVISACDVKDSASDPASPFQSFERLLP